MHDVSTGQVSKKGVGPPSRHCFQVHLRCHAAFLSANEKCGTNTSQPIAPIIPPQTSLRVHHLRWVESQSPSVRALAEGILQIRQKPWPDDFLEVLPGLEHPCPVQHEAYVVLHNDSNVFDDQRPNPIRMPSRKLIRIYAPERVA